MLLVLYLLDTDDDDLLLSGSGGVSAPAGAPAFWSAAFWSPGFWADGFWGLLQTTYVDLSSADRLFVRSLLSTLFVTEEVEQIVSVAATQQLSVLDAVEVLVAREAVTQANVLDVRAVARLRSEDQTLFSRLPDTATATRAEAAATGRALHTKNAAFSTDLSTAWHCSQGDIISIICRDSVKQLIVTSTQQQEFTP